MSGFPAVHDLIIPGGNVEQYVSNIMKIPVLSAEEERKLAEKLYFENCLESARLLVMSHLRFVVHIANSYAGYNQSKADLIQEGNVGLMKAVRKFNPEKGFRLATFAVHWIKAEILEFIIRNYRQVRVITTKAQRKLFFNLRSMKKDFRGLTQEEAEKIAEDLGVKVSDVLSMESRMFSSDVSYDLPGNSDDDEPSYSPSEYLSNKKDDPLEQYLIEENHTVNEQMIQLIDSLDERSKDIIKSRWLEDKQATLHDLADKYGVSAERIRQLEANSIKKIKLLANSAK